MNIAATLKAEVIRLANKMARQETVSLRAGLSSQRKYLAALKLELESLQKQVKRLAKAEIKQSVDDSGEATEGRKPRFKPDMVKKDRARLGLSQAQYGKLIGVSSLSIFKYESGRSIPRRLTLHAIAGVRSIGKREASARLETEGAKPKRARAKRKLQGRS